MEIIEEYEEIDMHDVVKMLEKQDDLIEIQRLIIQLLLLSGFLTLLLLVFLVYRLNLHFKWLTLLHATAKTMNQDATKSEKTAETKPEKGNIATFVLEKPVMTIENDFTKDQVKLQPKATTEKKTPKMTKFKKSVVKGLKTRLRSDYIV
eukprot:TRINITY_DN25623_c0_g1_i1.p1 TRINITY_DN25623_c0_g1~~TRINITY_DN25623_c0_g1_i1.p1  ORF type:complete len:171 (-),score=54.18 TRINITY_DN25623_c0_g1_i1:80-526(-)